MDLVGLIVTLICLCLALWIVSKILDLALKDASLPAEVKPIALGLILLIGIIMMFRGYYIRF